MSRTVRIETNGTLLRRREGGGGPWIGFSGADNVEMRGSVKIAMHHETAN